MKKIIFGTLCVMLFMSSGCPVFAQRVTTRNIAKKIRSAATLPATCKTGEVYRDSDATSGQQFYICETANTWVAQGGGGGMATKTVCSSTTALSCDYTCTGADDDVQIQAAIDAVIAATANYGEVRLTEGVFNLKDTINIVNSASVYSRIGIVGTAGNGTQVHAQDNFADDSDTVMFQFYETTGGDDTTAGLVFRDILFTGNDANIAIGFIDTMRTATFELWDLRIFNCLFFSFRNTVLTIDDPWGFQFVNSIIEDCDQGGIVINAGTFSIGSLILGNKIVTNGDQENGGTTDTFGIKLNGVQHTRIIGNELDTEAVGGYAIELIDSDQNIILGNTFAGGTAAQGGIKTDGTSDRNTISTNQFTDLAGIGILIGGTNNVFMSNAFFDITGVEISDSGTDSIFFSNWGDDAISKTNTLRGALNISDTVATLNPRNIADAASNSVMVISGGDRASPTAFDEGYIQLGLDDSNGTLAEFGRLTWIGNDLTSNSKDGAIEFEVPVDNAATVVVKMSGDIPLEALLADATTNTTSEAMRITHTGGTIANNFGTSIDFYQETETEGVNGFVGSIAPYWIDATDASKDSAFIFNVVEGNATRDVLRIGRKGTWDADLHIDPGGSAGGDSRLSFTGGRVVVGYDGPGNTAYFGGSAGKHLSFETGGATQLYMDSQGKTFGIGITAVSGDFSRLAKFTIEEPDELVLAGTTEANATTAIVGSGTGFSSYVGVGDRISLSSAASTYATVLEIENSTNLTVNAALGDGTEQTINLKKAAFRIDDDTTAYDANVINFIVNDLGYIGVGTITPQVELTVDGEIIATPPSVETIAGAATITVDACGTVKPIQASGIVTTNTTNTFTAPAAANAGCCMDVINYGGNAITLDNNAAFYSNGAADVVLGTADSARVCSNGSYWVQVGATGNN